MRLPSFQLKQPLSLKWKWTILLFLVFNLIGVASLMGYRHLSQEQALAAIKANGQMRLDQTQSVLKAAKLDVDRLGTNAENARADDLSLLAALENPETSLRLYNSANQLVYETRRLDVPTVTASPQVDIYPYKKQLLVIGTVSLPGSDGATGGTLQYIYRPLQYQEWLAKQQQLSSWVLVAILIFSLVFAYGLARYLLLPLEYLNNTLDLVEEESLSTIRVRKPRSNDEWSDLNIHVNRLLDKIDGYVQNQKQFVEDVSHELRTPVAIVEGHLQMLNRWGKDDPEILAESIDASLQEITRMKDLVQMMLDLSRAEHAEVDYKDEMTEIYATTRQVFNNFVMLYPNFRFYLDSEGEDKELFVKIYRNHFEQILIILLDNAVKYSTDRQEIHIAVSASFTTVEIAIQDFGEGMSQEDKQKVFGRFYRVDKARSRQKGGNGLGLSIAKQLVDSYKGRIYVESVLHHGSIFYVEFPILLDKAEIEKNKKKVLTKSL